MLRTDPAYADKARAGFGLSPKISCEYLATLPLARAGGARRGLTVAYHAACSLQHGQKIDAAAEGIAVAKWASR